VRCGDLESFRMKREMTRGELLFIGLKLSSTVLKLEPMLIVLKLISSDFGLKSLLMNVLSATVFKLEPLLIS
jgi:hypothetical protein